MTTPRPSDPWRVLGLPPDATLAEVKRAYRALAKRSHPDAAGSAATTRFLAIQQAYEAIVSGRGRPAPGPAPARGQRRETPADWYAAARDAARGRARQGSAEARRRRGPERPGTGRPDGARPGGHGPGPGHAGRDAGGADARAQRTATIGSTTYDDAIPGEPEWHGSAWYGAASGTYWTVNPREYADPRKHGPEYLARAAAAARDAASRGAGRSRGSSAAGDAPSDHTDVGAAGHPRAGGATADAVHDDAGRSPVGAVIVRLRHLLRPPGQDPRVR